MNGRVAKLLRRLFLDGKSGRECRACKRYEQVAHAPVMGIQPKGSFVMLKVSGIHRKYRYAKAVYRESTGLGRRQLLGEAHKAIQQREVERDQNVNPRPV